MKLLLVSEQRLATSALARSLDESGFVVDHAGNTEGAIGYLASYKYELVILDISIDASQKILKAMPSSPPRVLALLQSNEVTERIKLLNAGADDALVWPFAIAELTARLFALERRPSPERPQQIIHGPLLWDSGAHLVSVAGVPVPLTPQQFEVLGLLLKATGRTFSRKNIVERLNRGETRVSDRSIEVLIFTLRRRLSRSGLADLIKNERGAGYTIAPWSKPFPSHHQS